MKRVFWSSVIATFVLAAGASGYLNGTPDLRASDDGVPRRLPVGPESPEPARSEPVSTAAEPPASEHSQLLETIGTLTSAHYYQTYLNIGLIADGKARGTYTEADAVKVLESVLSLLKSVDRKLDGDAGAVGPAAPAGRGVTGPVGHRQAGRRDQVRADPQDLLDGGQQTDGYWSMTAWQRL
ncbi:MAG: hypothetical protein E6K70_24810 [Planctomycetota bacterium]|nr:MAG: hypothetical protein E6K70_24810 [Planctomycetota bacterium]